MKKKRFFRCKQYAPTEDQVVSKVKNKAADFSAMIEKAKALVGAKSTKPKIRD
jgi:hypothetical protein